MLKYTKILCAFDFDGNSTAALLLAGALAKESNATLHILHIARVPTQDMDVPLPFDADPRWEKEARTRLALAGCGKTRSFPLDRIWWSRKRL